MLWNDHSRDIPSGAHAFLGASKYSWLNYEEEDLRNAWERQYAQILGTTLHELASKLITNRIKMSYKDKNLVLISLLDKNIPRTVINHNMDRIMPNLIPYVNDGIGFRMRVEQPLVYSENIFGTADCISFDEKKKFLRIHDYKSGSTPARMEQLLIYASLFCLEYDFRPGDLSFELRIYQDGDQIISNPGAKDIVPIMDKAMYFDKLICKMKEDN